MRNRSVKNVGKQSISCVKSVKPFQLYWDTYCEEPIMFDGRKWFYWDSILEGWTKDEEDVSTNKFIVLLFEIDQQERERSQKLVEALTRLVTYKDLPTHGDQANILINIIEKALDEYEAGS